MREKRQKSYYDRHNLSRHASKRRNRINKVFQACMRWALLCFVAIIVGYAFVTFGFQTVTVVGPSMEPILSDSQVVVVNKLDYRFSDIERYDIVAFSKVNTDGYYDIKRVVGLPEETIRISNGDVYINGRRLTDLPFESTIQISGIASEEVNLGDNEYFLIGDNVNNSEDSRYANIGKISKTEITGKVVYVLYPKENRGKVKK